MFWWAATSVFCGTKDKVQWLAAIVGVKESQRYIMRSTLLIDRFQQSENLRGIITMLCVGCCQV